MNKLQFQIFLILICLFQLPNAWAFGRVEAIVGKVAVVNQDGVSRELSEGSRIEASDTIVTGGSAELLIKTDDDGIVFLKPNSKLLVESFSAKGNDQDNFAVRLLKGAFRGVTGFIGKTAPKRYRLNTPTATIGIRGTDYEAAIVEASTDINQAGTYAKVNNGEISLTSRGISVNVAAKQFAVAPTNAPPQLLDAEPAGLFGANQLDEKINLLIQKNTGGTALQTEQAEQKSGGGAVASGETRIPKNCAGDNPAQRTLDEFITAYERGDVSYIQRRLDPAMVGYGPFLNGIMEDVNAQKQIRFLIQNRNAQCGADLAIINFRWEKRFLDLVTFEPRLQTGQASVLTYLKAGEWKLSGISGENPFASNLNQSALLTVTPTQVSYASLPKTSTPSPTSQVTGTSQAFTSVFSGSPCLPDNSNDICDIAGNTGTIIAKSISCSGTPLTAAIITVSGTASHSSTGPSNGTVARTQVIPVSGSGNGQVATGTATCQANVTYPTGAPIQVVAPSTISSAIKLVSPNQTKAGSVQVEAVVSNGDREVYTLTETTPGVFTRNSGFAVAGGSVVPNNSVITVNGPTSITLRFIDTKTGEIASTVFRIN